MGITPALVTSAQFLDADLPEGRYAYTVTASDEAGLESEPSAPAELVADATPPAVSLHQPLADAAVSGLVDVVATAHSATDFKEYRLYVGPQGGAAELLRRSPLPVRAEVVAQWDTLSLPQGAL